LPNLAKLFVFINPITAPLELMRFCIFTGYEINNLPVLLILTTLWLFVFVFVYLIFKKVESLIADLI
jgi:ABC-type polysaccharide/polyol phosphate export permease